QLYISFISFLILFAKSSELNFWGSRENMIFRSILIYLK
ncbi:MAG: hypothetical protein ACI90V_002900, partial [Bacillariaceae sp.]